MYVLFLREAVKTNIANIPIQCLYLTHNALKYERHYTPLPQTEKKLFALFWRKSIQSSVNKLKNLSGLPGRVNLTWPPGKCCVKVGQVAHCLSSVFGLLKYAAPSIRCE